MLYTASPVGIVIQFISEKPRSICLIDCDNINTMSAPKNGKTALCQHVLDYAHTFKFDDTTVLANEEVSMKRKARELIEINKEDKSVNYNCMRIIEHLFNYAQNANRQIMFNLEKKKKRVLWVDAILLLVAC